MTVRQVSVVLLLSRLTLTFTSVGAAEPSSTCFQNTEEASGVSVIAFATGQQIAAEICDRTYGLWSPSLAEIAAQTMANSAKNPTVAQFMSYAEQYAARRHITISDVFREVGQSLQNLRSRALSREYCVEFARTLTRRLSSQDDLVSTAVLDAAVAKGTGKICNLSTPP